MDTEKPNFEELKNARFIDNQMASRAQLWNSMLNLGKDINIACGYPEVITIIDYNAMYSREGIAKRVVKIEPEESWSVEPVIIEDDKPERTKFEKAWDELAEEKQCLTYLQRVDELSGIGRYGALLLGFSDGKDLSKPVTEDSEGMELLYLRAFSEFNLEVQRSEDDVSSPRFGFPIMYNVKFDTESTATASIATTTVIQVTKQVHWTRILHVADNLESSETYGTPRMQQVYNRLLDIRKIISGSAEMFWKGAFPGYVFEVNPDLRNPKLDKAGLRAEFDDYSQGLQRYLALEGVSAKSLSPQIAEPDKHLESQMNNIAITIGVPKRIFMGSEQAKLASTTDKETWSSRLQNRQRKYISPRLLKPFIQRMQKYGILPEAMFKIFWPDLNTRSDKEKAEVGLLKTKAMGEYVQKEVHQLIPPEEFMRLTLKMTETEVKAIKEASEKWVKNHKEIGKEEPEPKQIGQPVAGTVESVEKTGDKAVRDNA
jgi:hypothetical protein